MHEIIGWIGSFLLGICGVFGARSAFRDKKCLTDSGMLWTWFIGEVFVLIYVIPDRNYPLIFNYGFNILFLIVMLYYKYFPRRDDV